MGTDAWGWSWFREMIIAVCVPAFLGVGAWAIEVNHRLDQEEGRESQSAALLSGDVRAINEHLHAIDQRLDRLDAEVLDVKHGGSDNLKVVIDRQNGVIERLRGIDGQQIAQDGRIANIDARLAFIEYRSGLRQQPPGGVR